MNNNRETGRNGETIAEDFLKQQNVLILERNYYFYGGEIDLIVKDFTDEGEYLSFIEVKYRNNLNKGLPEQAVGKTKQKRIIKGAMLYMNYKGIPCNIPCRFDVISIFGNEIKWIKNAFTL